MRRPNRERLSQFFGPFLGQFERGERWFGQAMRRRIRYVVRCKPVWEIVVQQRLGRRENCLLRLSGGVGQEDECVKILPELVELSKRPADAAIFQQLARGVIAASQIAGQMKKDAIAR